MKPLVLAAALVALSAPAAFAQSAPKHNVADTSQAQSDVPDTVKTYVRQHAGDPIAYDGVEIRVGHKMDSDGLWLPIPDHPEYRFSNLSGQLVVIDAKSSKVVAIY